VIDGVVALCMALGVSLKTKQKTSIYERQGIMRI
jgi:hypothetical protein